MSSTTKTVGQITDSVGVAADRQYANVPVVVETAGGKERVVTGAHFDGRRLVLTTGK